MADALFLGPSRLLPLHSSQGCRQRRCEGPAAQILPPLRASNGTSGAGRREALRHTCINDQKSLRRSSFLSDVRWKAQAVGRNPQRQRRCFAGGVQAIFTGIVEEMGTVRELKQVDGGWELTIEASTVLEDVKLGDSIAVNGTCLTVTRFDPTYFAVGLAPETLRKTSLEELETGSKVNLERSLQPSGRMGGHFVQGHVDGTGVIARFAPDGDSVVVTIKTTPELLRYIVKKGYIAVDGTSLTVVDVLDAESSFTFMLVAYTQQKIVLPLKKEGDKVNLEVDIVGKYVERMTEGYRIEKGT